MSFLHYVESDEEDDDGLPPDPMGIARVSDALQAHMWPNMEMEEKGGSDQSKKDEAAASGGREGVEEEKGKASKEGLSELEEKVAASMTSNKEDAKKKVGKNHLLSSYLSYIIIIHVFSLSLPRLRPPSLSPVSILPPSPLSPSSLPLPRLHPPSLSPVSILPLSPLSLFFLPPSLTPCIRQLVDRGREVDSRRSGWRQGSRRGEF